MKYRNKTKHPIAFLVAAILACQPISAQAVTFADMNNVPWPGAETSINKAAELKLVVGETINGKNYFKPKDPVSLTQACQLAYKLLLETGKADADTSIVQKWTTVMNTYKIQSWAHPAVSFCLENGIVQISDLSTFIKGEVNVSATREQAAEILGRALTVGVPSLKATASTTNFKDNANISADARPYIALLNAQKIVNGDDLGKFNPKNTLNRTETAVMVTNLYDVLNKAAAEEKPVSLGTQSGKVNDMNALYVNLENSNAYFLFNSSATVTLNGDSASVSEIVTLFKDGSEITATLTLDSNNRITTMAATAEIEGEEEEKETEGIITKITHDDEEDSGKLEINDKSSYKVKNVDDVDIEITDEDGDEEEYDWEELVDLFKECKDDDKAIEVELTLDKNDKLQKIVGEITDADDDTYETDETEGEIESITYNESKEKGEIKIDGETYKVPDTENVDVEVQDGDEEIDSWAGLYDAYRDGKIMDLKLELDDDEVVEVTGRVTVAKGYLVDFENDCLTLEGRKSDVSADYYFTEYDRYEDDEAEEDEEDSDDWVDDTESIKIKGLSNISNLYDFFEEWLDDDRTELGTDDKDDCFLMEFTLDKDGFITSIKGERK